MTSLADDVRLDHIADVIRANEITRMHTTRPQVERRLHPRIVVADSTGTKHGFLDAAGFNEWKRLAPEAKAGVFRVVAIYCRPPDGEGAVIYELGSHSAALAKKRASRS